MSKDQKFPIHMDLHGIPIHNGFHKTVMFIKIHVMKKTPHIKIITGMSGKMNGEFERWMEHPFIKHYIKSFKSYDNHGSWLVTLKV